jgi:SNF2 family DNA or RNA helicase
VPGAISKSPTPLSLSVYKKPGRHKTPVDKLLKSVARQILKTLQSWGKVVDQANKKREKLHKELFKELFRREKIQSKAAKSATTPPPPTGNTTPTPPPTTLSRIKSNMSATKKASGTNTPPPPSDLYVILSRIDDEMQRIGMQLENERGGEGTDQANDTDVVHKCLENSQAYYHRVHHDQTNIFPEFPQSAFKGDKALKPFQWEGVRWLGSLYVNDLNGILADEMGLGKTIQIISFLTCLKHYRGVTGPHLIVAPLSVLPNWKEEFTEWAPSFRVATISEYCEQDLNPSAVDVIIVNYEFFLKPGARAVKHRQIMRTEFVYLIADEGHRLKNSTASTFAQVCKLKCSRRVILTGTPLQNNFEELFVLLHFVMPNVFGTHFEQSGLRKLLEAFMHKEGDVGLAHLLARMHQLLRPFILRREAQAVAPDTVPENIELCVECPLSAVQIAEANLNLTSSHKLRKIALHPYLLRREYDIDESMVEASGKLRVLDDILQKLFAAPTLCHKVIIFTLWTQVLEILEDYVNYRQWGYCRLDGSTSTLERQARIAKFTADNRIRIFLISKKAGAHGLNLQAADTVVLYDTDYNPTNDDQAMARVCRIGQNQDVRMIRLLCGHGLEDRITELANVKTRGEKLVIRAAKLDLNSSVSERLTEIHDAIKDEGGRLRHSSDPPHITEILARSPEERECFSRMDNFQFQGIDRKRGREEITGSPAPPGLRLVLKARPKLTLTVRPKHRVLDTADSGSDTSSEEGITIVADEQ